MLFCFQTQKCFETIEELEARYAELETLLLQLLTRVDPHSADDVRRDLVAVRNERDKAVAELEVSFIRECARLHDLDISLTCILQSTRKFSSSLQDRLNFSNAERTSLQAQLAAARDELQVWHRGKHTSPSFPVLRIKLLL